MTSAVSSKERRHKCEELPLDESVADWDNADLYLQSGYVDDGYADEQPEIIWEPVNG